MTHAPEESIPKACDDWADAKAAYRFLSNPRVAWEAIQTPHRHQTRVRCAAHPVVLCVQDTTFLDYTTRTKTNGLGPIGNGRGRGLIQHSTLAVTPEREVLGILHQILTLRQPEPKGETRRQRLSRPKESDLWSDSVEGVGRGPNTTRFVHVCDRAGDSFQTMDRCDRHGCGFLIRVQHNRNINGKTGKLWSFIAEQPVLGCRTVDIPSRPVGPARRAILEVRSCQVTLDPSRTDPRFKAPRQVWVVSAVEKDPAPASQEIEPIEWMLLTSERSETLEQANQRVEWYACRWIIEEFHKAEKTGCRLEASQLDDAEDIKRLAALVTVIAVRLLQLRNIVHQAIDPSTPERNDPAELQRAVPWLWIVVVARAEKKKPLDPKELTPREFWWRVAKRGGFLGRRHDGRPGWSTIWKGWSEFMCMFHGAELMAGITDHDNCG
jgi:hypothetical protein